MLSFLRSQMCVCAVKFVFANYVTLLSHLFKLYCCNSKRCKTGVESLVTSPISNYCMKWHRTASDSQHDVISYCHWQVKGHCATLITTFIKLYEKLLSTPKAVGQPLCAVTFGGSASRIGRSLPAKRLISAWPLATLNYTTAP